MTLLLSYLQLAPRSLTARLAFALVLLWTASPAFSDEIIVGFGKDKPPFVFGRDARGLEIDIFREALALSGHTVSVRHFDNDALVEAVLKGRVDAVATARSDNERLCQVDEFIRFDNVAISLEEAGANIATIEDLAAYRLVAWQGAYQDLGGVFYDLFSPDSKAVSTDYLEHHSQEAQVKMFWLNRADVLIIDKVIFGWYRMQLGPEYRSQRAVAYHPVFDSPTHFPALFTNPQLCAAFGEGLARLKQSGRYEVLYGSYLSH